MANALWRVIGTLLLSHTIVTAAEYWVATNGNNNNSGSRVSPWLTVAKAAAVAKTNDFIHVMPGTYDEQVTPSFSGAGGAYITYKGEGSPIIRGFDFTGKSNWAVIGFHFYHPTNTYAYDAIAVKRCVNFKILDNYFESINATHAVVSSGQQAGAENYSSYGIIRSNIFFRAGLTLGRTVPAVNINIGGTNNLIEYNDISQGDDFTRVFGQHNIVRNNYFHDCQPERFSNQPHVDGMQTFDAVNILPNFDHNLMECNLMVSNSNPNGHFYILQNPVAASTFYITDFTFRKNVGIRTGDGLGFVDDVPNVRVYNNTFVGVRQDAGQYDFCLEVSTNYNGTGTIVPTNFVAINNVFHSACLTNYGKIFSGNPGPKTNAPLYSVISHNLSYLSGPSIVPTMGNDVMADPKFVAYPGNDVHLASSSPAIRTARPQTTATTSGTTTNVVTVRDGGFFTDGWGITGVTGDAILVGPNTAATITKIDYALNALTLSTNISWSNGDGVFLDGTQDIGAFNYTPGGYSFGITLTSPTNHANALGPITLTAAVTNPSNVRIVRFYLDGIEIASAAPAALVNVSAIIAGTNSTVQARAYALYADSVLAATASATLNDRPRPPSNLITIP